MKKLTLSLTIICFLTSITTAQNYSLVFDGDSDYVEINDSDILSPSNFTIELWVKQSQLTSGRNTYVFKDGVTTDSEYNFNENTEGLYTYVGSGSYVSSTHPTNDQWTHIATTFHVGTGIVEIFVNGTSVGTGTVSTGVINSNGKLYLGWKPTNPDYNALTGLIDEIRISDFVRYTSNFTVPSVELTSDGNTVALYHLNEGSGTTIIDASGYGNNGTINGAVYSFDVPHQGATWYISTTGSDLTGNGSQDYPFATIQHGIDVASESDTVLVQPGTYTENIIWPETNGINLISAGDSSNTIIDGGGVSSVIYMNPQTMVIDTTTLIQGFKITNGGNVSNGGGVFLSGSSPALTHVIISGNSTTGSSGNGGGIYMDDSSPTLSNVTIINNFGGNGGGMFLNGSSPILFGVTITGNSAGSGGGMELTYSNPTLTNVTISGNSAIYYNGRGGGMYLSNSNPVLTDIIITGNFANLGSSLGGGMYLGNSNPVLTDAIIAGNSVNFKGGGIYMDGSSPILIDVTITGNSTSSSAYGGGGMYLDNSEPSLTNINILRNHTNGRGGGIYMYSSSPILTDGAISNNSANESGGGVYIRSGSPVLSNLTISSNSANLYGSGLCFSSSSATLSNLTIASNNGNGIYIYSSIPNISQSNFVNNGFGVYNADNSNIITATVNYWGGESGPNHPSQNPSGQGDSANTFVNVTPWLTAPNTDAPPIPAQNTTMTGTGNDFVSLTWDSSAMGDLAGYKVYYDTDTAGYPYTNSVDVSNVTTYTLSSLTSATTYYIAVTTYDTDGNESWYSNEMIGTTRIMEVQDLDIAGNENLQHLITHTPIITFRYYDSMNEIQTSYQMQVSTDSDFSSADKWDSGEIASNDTSVTYAGTTLEDGLTYYLRVKVAATSFWSDWSTLTFRMNSKPTIPAHVSPVNNQVSGTPVILTVLNAIDAEGDTITYSFNVYSDMELTTQLNSVSEIVEGFDSTSWQITATLPDNGQYWWTTSANDDYEESAVSGSAFFLLNSINDEPAAFSLISPADSSEVTTLTPLLDWAIAADPDPLDTVKYTLYLDTPDPGVTTIMVDTSTSYQVSTTLSDNTTYQWKVVAVDLNGASTESTDGYRSFRVNTTNDLPGDFALLNPENGSMVTDLTPTFHWDEPTDPDDGRSNIELNDLLSDVRSSTRTNSRSITSYNMFISIDSLFSGIIPDTVTTNSYTPSTNLNEDMVYYWKVEAVDDDGGVTGSTRWSFWTNSQNSFPSNFSAISPFNGGNVDTIAPTFTWHPSFDDDLNDMVVYNIYLGESIEDIESVYTGFVPWITDTMFTLIEPVADNTTYYWYVVATDISGATTVNMEGFQSFSVNLGNEPPSQVTLVAPLDGSIQTNLQPHFNWTESVDPDPQDSITYTLNWWPISPLPVIYGIVLDTNGYVPTDSLTDNSLFEWRVEARDLLDSASTSDTSHFYTDAFPEAPLAFNTISPLDSAEGLPTEVEFIWNKAIDPDPIDNVSYRLILFNEWGDSNSIDIIPVYNDTMVSVILSNDTEYFWMVEAMDEDEMVTLSNNEIMNRIVVGTLSIDDELLPNVFALHQNYPNPFNPVTTLRYDLPAQANVNIIIYDMLGREVRTLVNQSQNAGFKSVIWNATNEHGKPVSAGVYLYQIQAGDFVQTKKMVLLK